MTGIHKKINLSSWVFLRPALAVLLLVIIFGFRSGKLANFFSASRNSQTFVVLMDEAGFTPQRMTVLAGDKVRFENKGSEPRWPASDPHPTHDFYPGFDSLRQIEPGSSWEFTFRKFGEWGYHDHLSPHHRGEIIVMSGGGQDAGVSNNPPREILALRSETDPKKQATIVKSMAEKYGPKEALAYMKDAGLPYTGETHLLVHEIGNVAYEKYGDKALLYCDESFLSACYHGVVLHELADHGMDGVAALMKQCEAAGPSVLSQCSHAAGHGFLAYNDYKVLRALPMCDKLNELDKNVPEFNCHDGVFMENIFGVHDGQPSPNRMLKDDDKYYPCDAVPEKYRPGCWADQATRMYQMFGGDLKKVALGCDGVTNQEYKTTCYHNFARQIHPLTQGKIEPALTMCKNATGSLWQDQCLITLVDAAFSVGDKKQLPYELCAAMKNSPKLDECYDHVFSNISGFTQGPSDTALMCGLVEDESKRDECAQRFQVILAPKPAASSPSSLAPISSRDDKPNVQEIKDVAKKDGVAAAYELLKKKWGANPVEAHDLAHLVGVLAYDEQGAKGISLCDMSFAFGCYHGFFEMLMKKEGEKGITIGKQACNSLRLPGAVASCLHGIGHGIMGTDDDVRRAIGKCESLAANEKVYCFDGVYMEYFTGAMRAGAKSLHIDKDKPWDFCLGQTRESQEQCVRNETIFFLYAGRDTVSSVAGYCDQLAQNLKFQCVNSTGLFATQQSHGKTQAIKDVCVSFKNDDDKSFCTTAAARELIFEGFDALTAKSLCKDFNENWQKRCEDAIAETARDYGR